MLQRDGIFSSSSFVQANLVAAARQHNKCAFNRAGGGDPSVMLFFFLLLSEKLTTSFGLVILLGSSCVQNRTRE